MDKNIPNLSVISCQDFKAWPRGKCHFWWNRTLLTAHVFFLVNWSWRRALILLRLKVQYFEKKIFLVSKIAGYNLNKALDTTVKQNLKPDPTRILPPTCPFHETWNLRWQRRSRIINRGCEKLNSMDRSLRWSIYSVWPNWTRRWKNCEHSTPGT